MELGAGAAGAEVNFFVFSKTSVVAARSHDDGDDDVAIQIFREGRKVLFFLVYIGGGQAEIGIDDSVGCLNR